ncbi:MAG: YfiR family protein [Terriglobia bacterium]
MRRIPQDLQVRRTRSLPLKAAAMIGVLVTLASLRVKAAGVPTEYDVKAAYLYNFARFVQWPTKGKTSAGASFPVCVLGMDPFGRTLDRQVAGQTIDSMSVVARRVSTPEEAAGCRILFISSSEDSALNGILSTLSNASVLTVSDMPQFTERGGMVSFILQNNRIRFDVNLAAAKRAGLILSSQLLKLAASVKGDNPPAD